jgi:hypothetical protein
MSPNTNPNKSFYREPGKHFTNTTPHGKADFIETPRYIQLKVHLRFATNTPYKDWSGAFTSTYYELLEQSIHKELEELLKNKECSQEEFEDYKSEVAEQIMFMRVRQMRRKILKIVCIFFVILCIDIKFGGKYLYDFLMMIFGGPPRK